VALWPDEAVFPLDDAALLGGVQYLAGDRRVGRDGLDPVDGLPQAEFAVFQVRKQFDAEFDPLLQRRAAAWLLPGHTDRSGGDHKAFDDVGTCIG